MATEVDKWAKANHVFLERCFERHLDSGSAPTLEQLQHDFAGAGEKVDVRPLAYSMPSELGSVELDRVLLRVAALRYVPAAAPILHIWFSSLKIACRRWLLGGEAAYLSRRDVLTESNGDSAQARFVSYLLLNESWPLGEGKGGPSEEWWRRITSAVLVVDGARDVDEVLNRGRNKERRGDNLLVRGVRLVFRDPVGASVIGGLVLAGLFWALSSIHPKSSSNENPEPHPSPPGHSKPGTSPGTAAPLSSVESSGRRQPKRSPASKAPAAKSSGRTSKRAAPSGKGPAHAPKAIKVEIKIPHPRGVTGISSSRSLGKEVPLKDLLAPLSVCPGQDASGRSLQAQEAAMECMVNYARRRSNVPALTLAAPLDKAADRKSRDILNCQEFSHEACGHDFTFWMEHFGYPVNCVAEDLAWESGFPASVRPIFQSWIRSAGQRQNMLGDFAEIGVGLKDGSLEGIRGAMVWTLDFGAPCPTSAS